VLLFGLFATVSFAADLGGAKADKSKPVVTTQKNETTKQIVNKPTEITTPPVPQIVLATAPKAGEEINWQVLSGGGTKGDDGTYYLSGTVGQTAVRVGTYNIDDQLRHGYWQFFGGGYTCCIPPSVGDLDQSALGPPPQALGFNYDGADLSLMINGLFIDPANGWDGICLDEADVDFTSERPVTNAMVIDGADLSILIDALFIAPTHYLKNCDGTDNW